MTYLRSRSIGNMAALAVLIATLSLEAAAQQAALTPNPPELNFGGHDIGTTSYPQTATTENQGTKAAGSVSVTISGDYSWTHNCAKTLGPQEHCKISVSFKPTQTGERAGTLTVNYSSQGAPQPLSLAVPLSGEGYEPLLKVSPLALDFGQQIVATTSVVRTVKVTAGPKEKVDTTVAAEGDFTVTPASCHLEPAASCALTVTFAPKQSGPTESSLSITSNVFSTFVPLSGEGVWRCPAPSFLDNWRESFAPVLFVIFLYLSGIILVRWNMVARPARKLLRAQIDAVRAEVSSLNLDATDLKRQQVLDLLTLAESPFLKGSFSKGLQAQAPGVSKRQKVHFLDFLLWTRGEEIAAWGYVHAAEELLADLLLPETVRARLENADQELRRLNTPPATALAERINRSLAASTAIPDRLGDAVREALQCLAPKSNDLPARIDKALADPALADPAATLPDDWKDVLQKIQDTLLPRVDALTATVDAALAAVLPADTEILKQLQKDADDRIKSPAAQLKTSLQAILVAQGGGEPPQAAQPPSVAAWLSLLRVARDLYTAYTDQLAAQVKVALALPPAPPLDRWRALLREALGMIYDNSDRNYSEFMSWQNKSVWLTGCGLLFIATLAAVLQHGGLLLVGAVGGLLSRLSRSLQRANVPTDYGASWSTLFLSPVVGALAGWSGVLLVILAVQLNVLGPLFKTDWCNPWSPLTLGIAFLLGFSERAFDSILKQLEDKTQAQAQTSAAQAQELSITTDGTLTPGKLNSPYGPVALAPSGGTPPYTWTLTAGKLPDGLNLDPAGKITGTPTAAGSFKFTLQVSDAAAKTKSQEFTIVVA